MGKLDRKISEELKSKQSIEINKEIEQLHSIKKTKGNAAAIFKLKEKVTGSKKEPEEPTVILNPKTNEPIFKPSLIVEACADYCQELLTN